MIYLKIYVSHCLKLTLMWAMLLWALTLPGQEVAVYAYLFHGTAAPATFQASFPENTSETKVTPQAVHAFADAKPSSLDIPSFEPAVRQLPYVPDFRFPPAQQVLRHAMSAGATNALVGLLLPGSLLPNAP
jgi:hypothetical protein